MSADNFYLIRLHPKGGFAAVMGFASDDNQEPPAREDYQQFDTVRDAVNWACGEYTEYGVSIHRECDPFIQALTPSIADVAHEVAEKCNNPSMESSLRLYLEIVERYGFRIVRA